MRFVAALAFIFLAMVLAQRGLRAQTPAGQASQPWLRTPHLVEPVFGIDYDPVLVRFEPEPERLARCARIGDPRGQLFVFAHIISHGIDYFWLDGWLRHHPDGPDTGPFVFEADFSGGWIVIVRGKQCKVACAMCNFTTDPRVHAMGKADGITDDVAAALLHDAIGREVQAFGGTTAFLQRIDALGAPPGHTGECTAPISGDYPLIQMEEQRLRCPTRNR